MHEIITIIAKYFVLLPVIALVFTFWRAGLSGRKRLVFMTIVGVVFTAVLVKLATTIHQDPRPFVRDGVHPYFASSTDNGFPSDHTAFSALIGYVVLIQRRRLGMALLILALIIGSARVIAGVHHAQDIVGGFLASTIAAGLSYLLLRAVLRFRNRRAA